MLRAFDLIVSVNRSANEEQSPLPAALVCRGHQRSLRTAPFICLPAHA
jgi:hypothetical protein